MRLINMRVEGLTYPLGVDTATPAFSWQVVVDRPNWRQSAFQVLVAADAEQVQTHNDLLWDSGRFAGDYPQAVPQSGLTIASMERYCWQVRVWDETGQASEWSAPAWFGTGMLRPTDWQARWIGRGLADEPVCDLQRFQEESKVLADLIPDDHIDPRSTLLRREIQLPDRPVEATVFVTGLGFYELYINGRKVGDHVLAPSRTDYRFRVLYDAYEATGLLHAGLNGLGLWLGNGWYNPLKKHWNWRMQWHGSPRAILQLHLRYADGRTEVLGTDRTWTTRPGPITCSCIYDGETYDARLEHPGWSEASFDDTSWAPANEVSPPGGVLRWHDLEPIRVTEHISPSRLAEPRPGTFVFDMGQNFAGWARLRAAGPAGSTITVRSAENLYPDGTLNNLTSADARQADTFILAGAGLETYEPRFSYHGGQYIEMTGHPARPTLDSIEGCVIRSDCAQSGTFECDNEAINHIHRCTVWSQKSNMPGLPTDDCQRAERLGWLGDAHVGFGQAVANFEMDRFYRKYLRDLESAQHASGEMPIIAPRPVHEAGSVCWGSAYPLLTWYHYREFGDRRILQEHLEGLRRYVQFMLGTATDFILPPDRFGDHTSPVPGWKHTKPSLASTWYFLYDSLIVSWAAGILGREDLSREHAHLAQRITQAFNARFLDPATGWYGEGTQCEQVMPLYLDIVPRESRKAAVAQLVAAIEKDWNGHIAAGILGTRYMLECLDRLGRSDLAWRMVTQTTHPSWINMCQGRTTLSETWDQLGGTNNHIMYGCVDAWFYGTLAGIVVDESAVPDRRLVLQPYFAPGLGYCRAQRPTIHGPVHSHWRRQDSAILWNVDVPAAATAVVRIRQAPELEIRLQGRAVWPAPAEGGPLAGLLQPVMQGQGVIELHIGSGRHSFEIAPK